MPRAQSRARGGSAAERRARILEAGMRLFAAMPYAEVHMDAVAAAAGVAKPTLYRYLPTKEALFIEGLAWELAALRAEIGAARDGTAAERLERAVALVLERVGRLSPAIQAVEGHGAELGERSRHVLRQGFSGLRDELGGILRDGAACGAFAAVDVELAVLMILGGVRMAALAARTPVEPSAVARLLLDGLRPSTRGTVEVPGNPANETSGPRRPVLGAVA
jgi:AcrR family transcriptional regulator